MLKGSASRSISQSPWRRRLISPALSRLLSSQPPCAEETSRRANASPVSITGRPMSCSSLIASVARKLDQPFNDEALHLLPGLALVVVRCDLWVEERDHLRLERVERKLEAALDGFLERG